MEKNNRPGSEREPFVKKTLYLKGINCSSCASEIEKSVSRIDGVTGVSLDITSGRLIIEAADAALLTDISQKAARIASTVEKDVKVSFSEKPEDEEESQPVWKRALRRAALVAGALVFITAIIADLPGQAGLALFLAAYLLIGSEVLLCAARNIASGRVFDENFLMCAATFGALAIGEYPEAVAVMLFYQIGELFQNMAVNRSRRSISSLMDLRPDHANLKSGGEIKAVPPEAVATGNIIVVKPGERVPLDGKIISGSSSLDTSALTGESVPRPAEAGDEVLSGSINGEGLLELSVTREFADSAVARILQLVRESANRKARIEGFITRFARYYTPAVVFSALALAVLPPLLVPGQYFSTWLNRALVFLVVSCPCALVVSVPLGFFAGIGSASKRGVLVKGGAFLDALAKVDTVVFDKTGTLTKGVFTVTKIDRAQGFTDDDVLALAAHAEAFSNHPIALSIRTAYGRDIDSANVSGFEELAGRGVRVQYNGKEILAGSKDLLIKSGVREGLELLPAPGQGTPIYIASGGRPAGRLTISDEPKPDAASAVSALTSAGVRRVVMLTGDAPDAAADISSKVGINEYFASLLPGDKVSRLEELAKEVPSGRKIVFVGDGINDAPVLARADVGVAMGGLGSDAAIEAADAVIMTDEPSRLADAIAIAGKTRRLVTQNIFFALSVKGIILLLGALGFATMWAAVFGDVGVALLTILNSMRALRAGKKANRI